jgi:endoglycosylceramidase
VIGFEPMNEPGWGSAEPGTFEATTLTPFYSQMVATMRAAAPSSLVFIDTIGLDGFSMMTSLGRPTGDGVVFAPHFYPLGNNVDAVQDRMKSWADVGKQWNVPTFVGEFGTAQNDAPASADYMSAHFAALDALGIHGTEWEYSVASENWNFETFGLVAADGTERAIAAAVIRPFARAVAGDAVTPAFDTTTRVFTLTYTPRSNGTTNVSEISLPARAYPNGFDVELTGGCVDASQPNRLLVQADDGATSVSLKVTTR